MMMAFETIVGIFPGGTAAGSLERRKPGRKFISSGRCSLRPWGPWMDLRQEASPRDSDNETHMDRDEASDDGVPDHQDEEGSKSIIGPDHELTEIMLRNSVGDVSMSGASGTEESHPSMQETSVAALDPAADSKSRTSISEGDEREGYAQIQPRTTGLPELPSSRRTNALFALLLKIVRRVENSRIKVETQREDLHQLIENVRRQIQRMKSERAKLNKELEKEKNLAYQTFARVVMAGIAWCAWTLLRN
uniref:Uncharacterized protein n=1 Tax=Compsopogon caeruleus TaxID=31354 RepID=A0A7S1T570_9RHOD|mmetsp:Transcript_10777/g.21618  ORF Transcript_10777/g.21618 Transcript_10777/m.21618 type:complete len:249 (+) Transcript_10777:1664-2410(+)